MARIPNDDDEDVKAAEEAARIAEEEAEAARVAAEEEVAEEAAKATAEEGDNKAVDYGTPVADGEGRWKYPDGVVTGDDGYPIEDEPVTKKPEAKKTTPKTATATEVTSRPIYSREVTKSEIYSDEAMEKIEAARFENQATANRMLLDLHDRYQEACAWIDRHANSRFDEELDELEKQAPQTVERFARQITRRRDQLTPEQRQQPGAARWIAAQVVQEALYEDPLAMEEAVIRSIPRKSSAGKDRSEDTPASKPQKRLIPPELRTPGPGTARRTEPSRRNNPGNGRDRLFEHYRSQYPPDLFPDVSDEEIREMAKARQKDDELRMRSR